MNSPDRSLIVLRAGIVAPIEALTLLWDLEPRGMKVTLEGDQLAVGPRDLITDDDRAAIRELQRPLADGRSVLRAGAMRERRSNPWRARLETRAGYESSGYGSGNSGKGCRLLDEQGVLLLGKRRDVADHPRLVLVNAPNMPALTSVVAEVRVRCILSYVRQIFTRVLRAARWAIGDWCHEGQVLQRTPLRLSSMTKRNSHARQRRHTRLPAMVTALTSARSQFGQGVTGRPPWSLGLGMLGSSTYCSREG